MRHVLLAAALMACGGGDGAPDAAAPTGPDAWQMLRDCTVAEAEALWDTTCTFGPCHGGGQPAAGLDLEPAAGSLQAMAGVASADCPGEVLVVAGDPEASYLIEKLLPRPRCGNQMPTQALTLEEVDCVRSAIARLPAQ